MTKSQASEAAASVLLPLNGLAQTKNLRQICEIASQIAGGQTATVLDLLQSIQHPLVRNSIAANYLRQFGHEPVNAAYTWSSCSVVRVTAEAAMVIGFAAQFALRDRASTADTMQLLMAMVWMAGTDSLPELRKALEELFGGSLPSIDDMAEWHTG